MSPDPRPPAARLDLRTRVELGRALGYWEQNLVDGRAAAIERLLAMMAPLAGRRVLDLACGQGSLARRIAAGGARLAVGCHTAAAPAAPWRGGARTPLVHASDHGLPFAIGAFDDVVLWEPRGWGSPDLYARTLEAIDALGAQRLFLVLREDSLWSGVARGASGEQLETHDFTAVLRELHLATGYRLDRTTTERRRNSVLRIARLFRIAAL